MNVYNLDKVPTLKVWALPHLRWLHSHGRKGGSRQGVLPSGNLSCSPEFSVLCSHCPSCRWMERAIPQGETQQTWNISLYKLSVANTDTDVTENAQSVGILLPLSPFLGFWVHPSHHTSHLSSVVWCLICYKERNQKPKFQQVQRVHYKSVLMIPLER